MAYTTPATWTEYGSSSKDSITFILDDHTVTEPHLVICDRKVPVVQADGSASKAQYRLRIIQGLVDSNNMPASQTLVETTIRWPINADTTALKAELAALAAVLADTDFQADAVERQVLPGV